MGKKKKRDIEEKIYEIYAHGVSMWSQYPNYGGWAYSIWLGNKQIKKESKYDIHTSRMGMYYKAILKALSNLPDNSIVTIYTEEKFIGRGLTQHLPLDNIDLIVKIHDVANEKNIDFEFCHEVFVNQYYEVEDMAKAELRGIEGNEEVDYIRFKTDKEYRDHIVKYTKFMRRNDDVAEFLREMVEENCVKDDEYYYKKANIIRGFYRR